MKNSDTLAVFCLLLRVGLLALSFLRHHFLFLSLRARFALKPGWVLRDSIACSLARSFARLLAGISTRISRCDVILHRPATPRRRFNLPCVMTFLLPLSDESPPPPLPTSFPFAILSSFLLLFLGFPVLSFPFFIFSVLRVPVKIIRQLWNVASNHIDGRNNFPSIFIHFQPFPRPLPPFSNYFRAFSTLYLFFPFFFNNCKNESNHSGIVFFYRRRNNLSLFGRSIGSI